MSGDQNSLASTRNEEDGLFSSPSFGQSGGEHLPLWRISHTICGQARPHA